MQNALADDDAQNIHGAAITPYLLNRISEITDGESLKANLALLKNNARVAAKVSAALDAVDKIGPY